MVRESPGFRPSHVAGFDGINFEPGAADQVVHIAIEVTAPDSPFQAQRQPIQPKGYSAFLTIPVDEGEQP